MFFLFVFFRHEKSQHPNTSVHDPTTTSTPDTKECEDHLYNYHRGKLAFGLLLLEFEDAIKEGDGDRVLNVYKLALLFYKSHGHNKYAYVTLLYLVKEKAALTEYQAKSMKHNRFYNKYGGSGRNIPLDLKMEQLNKVLKSLWRGLGPNLNESNAARVANALEGLEMIIDSVDKDCSLSGRKGYRSKGKSDESVKVIVNDLMEKRVFNYTVPREGHPTFPHFKSSLLEGLDYRDLHDWMTDLIKKWQVKLDK